MKILIEDTTINTKKLIQLLLDEPWHSQCEIISDYMPPNPRPETFPKTVVRYNNGTEYPAFLRHSCGPKQGFFWDCYGDNMQSVELAIIALSNAPYPRSVEPMVVKFPIRNGAKT